MSERAGEKRAGYLELFFDLVFVFAVTQLVAVLHHDHSLGGWRDTALLAWLIWWAWSQFAWAGNAIDLDRRATRVAILAVTGVTLVVAASIPHAFGDGGLRFAVPYAAVRAAGLGLYWVGLRGDPAHQAALRSYLPIAVVSPLVVLVGGAMSSDVRPWVWLAAVAVDVASAIAGGRGEFRVSPGHFAERHALIVIIAIGESIVGVGATVSALPLDASVVAATAAAFAIIALQWWGYFDWVQGAAESRLAGEPDLRRRGRLARDLYTFGHFPIVLGSVVLAFGFEEVVAHPADPLASAGLVALGVGLALFLGGFLAGNARAAGTFFVERAVALGLVAGELLLLSDLDAAILLAIVAITLGAVAAWEFSRRLGARSA